MLQNGVWYRYVCVNQSANGGIPLKLYVHTVREALHKLGYRNDSIVISGDVGPLSLLCKLSDYIATNDFLDSCLDGDEPHLGNKQPIFV